MNLAARLFLLLPLVASGCASHTWAPGPGIAGANFDVAKAQCSLMARHGGSGVVAVGSTAFVAGAVIGSAIGDSIRAQNDFNDCMLAGGWKIVDEQPKQITQVTPNSFPIVSANWVTLHNADGHIGLLISGWQQRTPTPALNQAKTIYATQDAGETIVVVTYDETKDITDLQAYIGAMQKATFEKLKDPQGFPMTTLDVNGHRAFRYEYIGTVSGLRFHYQTTIVQFDNYTVKVTGLTAESKFAEKLAAFSLLALGLRT
jgi:hypothetical protein